MEFFSTLQEASDIGLLALRIGVGSIFWVHGRFKQGMWKMQPSEQLPAPVLGILKTLSIAEPLGAVAIVLGGLTQIAAIGFCIVMLGAIPTRRKQGAKFFDTNTMGWELEFLILAGSLALVFSGGGQYSLDRLVFGIG